MVVSHHGVHGLGAQFIVAKDYKRELEVAATQNQDAEESHVILLLWLEKRRFVKGSVSVSE